MLQEAFRFATVSNRTKVAVVDSSRQVTYAQLQDAALAFADRLRELGARSGDRVALSMPNGVDAAIALWGTLEAGAVMVPLHAALKSEALRPTLEDADPHWIVDAAGAVAPRTPSTDEDSNGLAALLYTSGSTGEPRGVMLTHANMTAAIRMVNNYLRVSAQDIIYSALPLSSSYGLYQLLLGLSQGATIVLDRGFSFPASCLAFAARERATVMAAVPTVLGWMAHTPLLDRHDFSSLRTITSAAAALPPAHALRLRERLPHARLFVMYGQTECKRISYLDPDDLEAHADSVGKGMSGQQHLVVDAQDKPVAPGEVGELVVRGPHVMRGYWRKPAHTAQKLRRIGPDVEPWLFTGDAFSLDASGYLRFAGRKDEILKIGGHKVSPAEIENLLCRIPGIREAAVVGVPDQQWGQVAAAFLVAAEDSTLDADEIRRFCSQRLRGYMVPRFIRFQDSLPKTPSGKVLKRALDCSGFASGDTGTGSGPAIESRQQ